MNRTKQEEALFSLNELENFKCDMRVKYGNAWQSKMNDVDLKRHNFLFDSVLWNDL